MIEHLVKDLPEVYQPVFGHPQLSTAISRPCADRLQQIEQIYVALEKLLNRPLKVLDLGCAQGFFSLSLAQRGAKVHGVDYLDKNIALCHALAQENPHLHISFAEGRIEDLVPALQMGQYDLVLGLSVFHHLVHANGVASVKALLDQLAQVSGALVLEMALQSEPLYWGPSQPADPRELLHDIGFVHLVAHHGTHLAEIPRPLFIASNRYWILGEDAELFEKWSFESHANANGTHNFGRRYFFSRDFVLKLYRLDEKKWKYNKSDFDKEIQFLTAPVKNFLTPHLFAYGENEAAAWTVMQRLPGRLLLDMIHEGVICDSHKIILSVLNQLCMLESAGLFHNDVRTWNVLVETSSETVYLIDYGSISANPKDCVWPGNLFFSFFIFLKEVATGQVDNPNPLRTISISPTSLPDPYRDWAMSFWHLPMKEWSFQQMHQSLLTWPSTSITSTNEEKPEHIWMRAMEEAAQAQKKHSEHLHRYIVSTDQLNQALHLAETSQTQAQLHQQLAHAHTQEQQNKEQLQQALSLAQSAQAQVDQLNQQLAQSHAQEQQNKEQLQQALSLAQSAQAQVDQLNQQLAQAHAQEQQNKEQLQQALNLALAMQSQGIEQAQQLQQFHQQALSKHNAEALAQLSQVQAELDQVHQSNHHHWTELQKAQEELHNTHQANHHHWLQTQALQAQITALQNSWSWAITAPLRWGAGILSRPVTSVRVLANRILGWGINTFQTPLAKAMVWVMTHKAVSETINRWLQRMPHLHSHLVAIARKHGILPTSPVEIGISKEPSEFIAEITLQVQTLEPQLTQLSPRARQIHQQLQMAIKTNTSKRAS
jgi:O-antigen chain-terminating methyltransferase